MDVSGTGPTRGRAAPRRMTLVEFRRSSRGVGTATAEPAANPQAVPTEQASADAHSPGGSRDLDGLVARVAGDARTSSGVAVESAPAVAPSPSEQGLETEPAREVKSRPKCARPAASPQQEREEFTNLRIAGREMPADQWSQMMQTREHVPLSRFRQVSTRPQRKDRVLIGVIFERSNSNRYSNGEIYAEWRITDLAQPRPRFLTVQIRGAAFSQLRKSDFGAKARRGSIIALLNPKLEEEEVPRTGRLAPEPVARVSGEAQMLKLGDCPSLGKCEFSRCLLPCNADRGERFCCEHLARSYAAKDPRIIAGGLAATEEKLRTFFRKRPERLIKPVPEEEDEAMRVEEEAKRSKIDVIRQAAVALDERRFYKGGARLHDHNAAPRVPVIGRGLTECDDLELDMDMASAGLEERQKGDRLLQKRLAKQRLHDGAGGPEVKEQAQGGLSLAGVDLPGRNWEQEAAPRLTASSSTGPGIRPDGGPAAKRRRTAGVPRDLDGKVVLGQLVRAYSSQLEPQRGDARSIGSAKSAARSAAELEGRVQSLLARLVAAGRNGPQLKAVLEDADALPSAALKGAAAASLGEAICRLASRETRPELKRRAHALGKRWPASLVAPGCGDASDGGELHAGKGPAAEGASEEFHLTQALVETVDASSATVA